MLSLKINQGQLETTKMLYSHPPDSSASVFHFHVEQLIKHSTNWSSLTTSKICTGNLTASKLEERT